MGYSSKSPWLIHYDGSSCNGCDIEVLDSMMPLYDIERFGIINTGNPKHADIFLVTGSVNAQNIEVVRHIYDQMLEPKVVVACGICACTGGVFRDCYNVIGGVDKAIPVDVYAPGCAVRPETIIDAVLKAVEILDEKAKLMAAGKDPATAPRKGLLPRKGCAASCGAEETGREGACAGGAAADVVVAAPTAAAPGVAPSATSAAATQTAAPSTAPTAAPAHESTEKKEA